MKLQERIAYQVAGGMALISPFWRYRLWRRLSPADRHRSMTGCPSSWRRIQPHGYEMLLSENDWLERYAIHSGHYYQDDLSALIGSAVKAGSCFIDVGANIGFITLCAARAVGPSGQVFSVEASAPLSARLQACLDRNGIDHVKVLTTAAGDFNGEAALKVHEQHGLSSVSTSGVGGSVSMARLDDLVGGRIADGVPVFVKIDVEGFELAVLKGMPTLLARPSTRVFVEVGDLLASAYGATTQEIFDLMFGCGFKAYRVKTSPVGGRLSYQLLAGPLDKFTYDVLFSREVEPSNG